MLRRDIMSTSLQMQSISGIITQVHTTSGQVPPPLVGASVSVVGDYVFVFGGRLVTSRKMTNHMYVLDMATLTWTRHIPPPDSERPPHPRYFHSASVHGNTIVVFGGMGYSHAASEGLCVLDDISVFHMETMGWTQPNVAPSLYSPRPRYAHLSSVTDNKLIVVGGQDMTNNYLGELNVLDLKKWEWVQHVGAYRSIIIAPPQGTRIPHMQKQEQDVLLYLYTNYSFADVKRELQLIFSESSPTAFEDCSAAMVGPVMPPGLRFPTGHTLGHHLILAGTYLSPQSQSYTIWSLNLDTFAWTRIETGGVFSSGSWNRSVLHAKTNRLLVFGHQERTLLDDYNNRQVNFDHIAIVDMEAFGIYELPTVTCSPLAQDMGLRLLIVMALLQFIYTDNLLTAQQYQPLILFQLLLLSDMYELPRLRKLTNHALHQVLNMSTAPFIFETAALSHQTSLQIRALKLMIAAKKMMQQQQQQHQQQHGPISPRQRTQSNP
ncbi:hypothetical protein BDF14DRAFT_1951152 [Spinellus fusiger]|nr:hypothetical protein BDF14DRAFT_1951152 [Spinellus fusiger]